MIAYLMFAKDGNVSFYSNVLDEKFCKNCDSCLDRGFAPISIEPSDSNLDAFYTYDGKLIVSQKFKDFCVRQSYSDLIFINVNKLRSLYYFQATNVVRFDAKRSETVLENYCTVCNQYESVAGVSPGYLQNITEPLPEGFFRTDLEFGSGREKEPQIIVGNQTYEKILKEKLQGVEFEPIES